MKFYRVAIEIECGRGPIDGVDTNQAYISIGSEKNNVKKRERTPVECGLNIIDVKVPFVGAQSGIIVEALVEDLYIKSIDVYELSE